MRLFHFDDPGFEAAFGRFVDERRDTPAEVDATVRNVLNAVRGEGLAALFRFTREFDSTELTETTLRVGQDEIAAGVAACAGEVREAIAFAAARIRSYHERQRPADERFRDGLGVELGWRWTPLESVGIYVPGGRAAYPSTVLMNAVPASVAGVERIAMVTPPGQLQPAVLAAAAEAGITEIWRVGGAQAIAALAFGAGPIAPVDKIVGPGNAFVTAAKRQVYGVVGIDALAGPSEVVVIADRHARPDWIAADLLSQAEHDPAAQAVMITDDEAFASQVAVSVQDQIATLSTGAAAAASWRDHGAIVIAPLSEAPRLVNKIAPEHLEIAVEDPELIAAQIRHAGAIFLGHFTPEAIGDYVAGSNHVLPTSRAARFSSGLSLQDFLKRSSIVKCDKMAFSALASATAALAEAEGLPAHARSALVRTREG